MKVQGKNGRFYEVDESAKCNCSSYLQRGVCSHSAFFIDIFKNKASKNHYEIKAAFVADLRRGNPEAINWARLICRAKGNDYFVRLCRQLLRSETRNLTALEASYSCNDPRTLLIMLYESAMLHENPYYLKTSSHLIEAFYRYQSVHYRNYQSNVAMLREFMDEAHNVEDAYVLLYFLEDNRELINSFIRMLYDKAIDDKNWELMRYLELGDMHGPESWRFVVELMVRYWHREAENQKRVFEAPETFIPSLKTWHQPMKNMKNIIEKHHQKIRPNRRIAKDVKCDLRFSDSWFGFFWRSLAMQQKGRIEDLEWDDVEFTVNDWLSAQILDKRYYPTLYQNILLAG